MHLRRRPFLALAASMGRKLGTATLAANPHLYAKLGYDADKDFAPVGLTVRFPMILVVNPSLPAKNLTESLAWARPQKSVIGIRVD